MSVIELVSYPPPHQTVSYMRVGALPILPTTGSPVLSTETGGQRVFMKILKEEKGESLHPWDKAHLVMIYDLF